MKNKNNEIFNKYQTLESKWVTVCNDLDEITNIKNNKYSLISLMHKQRSKYNTDNLMQINIDYIYGIEYCVLYRFSDMLNQLLLSFIRQVCLT